MIFLYTKVINVGLELLESLENVTDMITSLFDTQVENSASCWRQNVETLKHLSIIW